MFEYLKNKAAEASSYIADTAKATLEWYGDMRVTPREKMITAVASIAGLGAAWAGFSLMFGSAPISLTTLAATPLATTVITGLAAGAGLLAKKAISGALNVGSDAIQAVAATHADRNDGTTIRARAYRAVANTVGQGTRFDRMFAGEYTPSQDLSEDSDSDYDSDCESDLDYDPKHNISEKEARKLIGDLGKTTFMSYTRPTLTQPRSRQVQYTVEAADDADYTSLPARTLRNGKTY